MKLNHLNLVVTNVTEAVAFFETYFGFTCTLVKGEDVIAVLKGDDDFTLVIMTAKENIHYPKSFHLGFMMDTIEKVDELYKKLKMGNVSVDVPREIRDSYGFYFHFDGIMIEVGYYLTA
jgi:predicted enzyme related to lactoylglutathione lyase